MADFAPVYMDVYDNDAGDDALVNLTLAADEFEKGTKFTITVTPEA